MNNDSNKISYAIMVTLIVSVFNGIWSIVSSNTIFIDKLSNIIIKSIIAIMLERVVSVTISYMFYLAFVFIYLKVCKKYLSSIGLYKVNTTIQYVAVAIVSVLKLILIFNVSSLGIFMKLTLPIFIVSLVGMFISERVSKELVDKSSNSLDDSTNEKEETKIVVNKKSIKYIYGWVLTILALIYLTYFGCVKTGVPMLNVMDELLGMFK